MDMTTTEAKQKAGGLSALAKIFGITPAAVHHWGEKIPRLRQYELREKRPEWFRKAKKA